MNGTLYVLISPRERVTITRASDVITIGIDEYVDARAAQPGGHGGLGGRAEAHWRPDRAPKAIPVLYVPKVIEAMRVLLAPEAV